MSETKKLKATIYIEYEIDGKDPGIKTVLKTLESELYINRYIGSEAVDGTDKWGIDVVDSKVTFSG